MEVTGDKPAFNVANCRLRKMNMVDGWLSIGCRLSVKNTDNGTG